MAKAIGRPEDQWVVDMATFKKNNNYIEKTACSVS